MLWAINRINVKNTNIEIGHTVAKLELFETNIESNLHHTDCKLLFMVNNLYPVSALIVVRNVK